MVHAGIMVQNSSIILHNLKCLHNSACLNNDWISNQVFGYQISNQEVHIGVFGKWILSTWISKWVCGNHIGPQLLIFYNSVIE